MEKGGKKVAQQLKDLAHDKGDLKQGGKEVIAKCFALKGEEADLTLESNPSMAGHLKNKSGKPPHNNEEKRKIVTQRILT